MDLKNNAWFLSYAYSFAYLECYAAFSEKCIEKLVHGVLLYLVVSSAL